MMHAVPLASLFVFAILPTALTAQDPAQQQRFPRGDAIAEGIDADALAKLQQAAKDSGSDALVIVKNGKLVVEDYFGREPGPIEAMSVTKSIVNLAIGHLLDHGKLTSLDQPVSELYPEWQQGQKRAITLRHLLSHRSGLQANRTTQDIYASPDFVQLALCAELSDEPGTKFFYNNKAVNLLAGVVEKATGERLDRYLGKHVFEPLGITDFGWQLDPAGNPHAMAGLQIRATDLAAIGQLLLDRGLWRGQRVISEQWIDQSMVASDDAGKCGLLWWLVPGWTKFGIDDELIAHWRATDVPDDFIAKFGAMQNRWLERREFERELAKIFGQDGMDDYYQMTWKSNRRDAAVQHGPSVGLSANGYLGQYLVVLNQPRLVAVRQIRSANHGGEFNDNLPNFQRLVQALVGR